MSKIVFRITVFMALMMITMTAQAKTQDWGEPMPFVNVVLLSLPDSAFVQGGMTDDQGIFKIVTEPPCLYIFRIKFGSVDKRL